MSIRSWLDHVVVRTRLGHHELARTNNRLRILCYHGIWAAPGPHFGDKLFMAPEKFEERVRLMKRLKLEVLPLREAVELLHAGRLPQRAAAITIDDGWASTFTHMLPVLEQHGYPATIYVQTERIDHQAPVADVALRYALEHTQATRLDLSNLKTEVASEIATLSLHTTSERNFALTQLDELLAAQPMEGHHRLLAAIFERLEIDYTPLSNHQAFDLTDPTTLTAAYRRGFEIALHTHSHSLGDFSVSRISDEIERNRTSLAAILGCTPETFRHFCWPSGDYTVDAVDRLRDLGVDLATTCNNGLAQSSDEPLLLPRILDGQQTSDNAFVTMVSGIHSRIEQAVARWRH